MFQKLEQVQVWGQQRQGAQQVGFLSSPQLLTQTKRQDRAPEMLQFLILWFRRWTKSKRTILHTNSSAHQICYLTDKINVKCIFSELL
jgi:hypothetical protein